jgi:hypothetical protein
VAQYSETVVLGFASWPDGRFELIVQDANTGEETTLKGMLEPGQLEIVDRILPTCVFVRAGVKLPSEAT